MLSYNLGTGRGDKEGGSRQQYRSRPRPVHVDDDELLSVSLVRGDRRRPRELRRSVRIVRTFGVRLKPKH